MATIKIKSGDQWTQIPMIGINQMPDAPSDGKTYGRKDGAWSEVNDGILVEDGGNGSVTIEIEPNVYYQFGECDSLTITLAEGTTGYLDEYMFEFSCPLFTATNFSNIDGISYANNKILIPKNNYKYQVSIKNNIASYIETQLSASILTYKTTGASESVQLIYKQEYANKITLEDGTDVPITGTGALNYTFAEAGNHKVAIELKEDVNTLSECFYYCSGLTGRIPENLFANNTAVTDFSYCFQGCSGLTGTIPENLFANCPNVTIFYGCFEDCSGLTGSIPANLFANNTAVDNFNGLFNGCEGLTGTIPENLFANCPNATSFGNCFGECSSLTGSIPANLFANNTGATTFYGCFGRCSGLTSIPENLFANCPNATDFSDTFYYGCFEGCRGLTSIPANLFASNTAVTYFNGCFKDCIKLRSIPSNLFASNTAVTTFRYCFSGCSSLTSIPANLFTNNTAVTTFEGCFRYCTGLTGSIPENLFANNTAVISFTNCFDDCRSLTGSCPVDNDGTPIYNRSGNGKEGYAIVDFYRDCFYNCTGLTDYNSIPSDWK